jgi:hypothetical protein
MFRPGGGQEGQNEHQAQEEVLQVGSAMQALSGRLEAAGQARHQKADEEAVEGRTGEVSRAAKPRTFCEAGPLGPWICRKPGFL